MNFSFILVEPAVAENVGASARALKTMGFDRLVIVNSKAHLEPRARWVAHGSADIMDNIMVFDTLEAAVRDADLVIGTTAKTRRTHADYYLCTEIPRLIQSKAEMLENVAIVFGREESGLSNEELRLCHIFSGVPMKTAYPSLNLAQTVMLYAWELMRYNLAGKTTGDLNARDQTFPEMTAGALPDTPSGDQAFPDTPAGGIPDIPAGDQSFPEMTGGAFPDIPAGDQSFPDTPSGDQSFPDIPACDQNFPDTPAGDTRGSAVPDDFPPLLSDMYLTKNPSGEKLRHLRRSVKRLLVKMGYDSQSAVYSRIMERFEAVGDKDAGLLLSVCSKIDELLPGNIAQGNEKGS